MMAGGRPYSPERFRALIEHVQTPFRPGRVGLALLAWRCDFDAYARLGCSITGATYVCARAPGEVRAPRSLLRAVLCGWRWGAVEHRIRSGRLSRADAVFIEREWRGRVPV